MALKVGDVVTLKSGGPQMTISEYPFKMIDGKDNYNIAECQWFNHDNQLTHSTFNVEMLDYNQCDHE